MISIFRFQTHLFFKQLLFVFIFVANFVLLSGCASAPNNSSLTATERQFLSRIDPNASVVTKIAEQTIEVFNATLPAEGLHVVLGESRYVDVFRNIEPVLESHFVYLSAAIRHCSSLGLQPDGGTVANTHAKRFTCHQPNQWAVVKLGEIAKQCESSMSSLMRVAPQVAYTSTYSVHPCKDAIYSYPTPVEYCAAYSNLTSLSPTSQLTCPAFLNQVKVIEARQTGSPATGQAMGGAKTIDSAMKECTGLGFTPKSEKHADCVLRLTK